MAKMSRIKKEKQIVTIMVKLYCRSPLPEMKRSNPEVHRKSSAGAASRLGIHLRSLYWTSRMKVGTIPFPSLSKTTVASISSQPIKLSHPFRSQNNLVSFFTTPCLMKPGSMERNNIPTTGAIHASASVFLLAETCTAIPAVG